MKKKTALIVSIILFLALCGFILYRIYPARVIGRISRQTRYYVAEPLDTQEDCDRFLKQLEEQVGSLKGIRKFFPRNTYFYMLIQQAVIRGEAALSNMQELKSILAKSSLKPTQEELKNSYTEANPAYSRQKKRMDDIYTRYGMKSTYNLLQIIESNYYILGLRASQLSGIHKLDKELESMHQADRLPGKVKIPDEFANPMYGSPEIGLVIQGDKPSCFVDENMLDVIRYSRVWNKMNLKTSDVLEGVLYNPEAIQKIMEKSPAFYAKYGKTPDEVIVNTFSKLDSIGELLGYGSARNIKPGLIAVSFEVKNGRQVMGFGVKPEELANVCACYYNVCKKLTGKEIVINMSVTPDKEHRAKSKINNFDFEMKKVHEIE